MRSQLPAGELADDFAAGVDVNVIALDRALRARDRLLDEHPAHVVGKPGREEAQLGH
jgi:hypothetical protein